MQQQTLSSIHQVWLRGALTALTAIMPDSAKVAIGRTIAVYGFSRRPTKNNRLVGINNRKALVISIHPAAWFSKVTVLQALLDGLHAAGIDPKVPVDVTALAGVMSALPGNALKIAPPQKGRMRLYTCAHCQAKIRSGRSEMRFLCLGSLSTPHVAAYLEEAVMI